MLPYSGKFSISHWLRIAKRDFILRRCECDKSENERNTVNLDYELQQRIVDMFRYAIPIGAEQSAVEKSSSGNPKFRVSSNVIYWHTHLPFRNFPTFPFSEETSSVCLTVGLVCEFSVLLFAPQKQNSTFYHFNLCSRYS